jgi:hypothetical protein
MDDLRIQIVNYKTKSYLSECLRSVSADLNGNELKYSVGILDNASGDDISDIPRLFPDICVEIVVNDKNNGFGAGHNLLAKKGEARYLLLLNPDIKIIEAKTIERMVGRANNAPAQIVGPRLVAPDGRTQRWDHGELKGLYAHSAPLGGKSYWKEQFKPLSVAWVSGAVFLIEKFCFDRLGGFDEKFFLYKEEEDLCLQLRQQGGVTIYDPTISVFHHGSVVAKKSEHMKESSLYFREKHLNRKN